MSRTIKRNLKFVIVVFIMALGLSILYDAEAEVKATSGASVQQSAQLPVTARTTPAHVVAQRN
ncbi:MAG: hypothetical protein RMM98_04790, partial [Acidobacteriota bacterium]|nr:hypothetical protein [Acidobacteriota bacterium]